MTSTYTRVVTCQLCLTPWQLHVYAGSSWLRAALAGGWHYVDARGRGGFLACPTCARCRLKVGQTRSKGYGVYRARSSRRPPPRKKRSNP